MSTFLFIDESSGTIVGAAEGRYAFEVRDQAQELMVDPEGVADLLICEVKTRLSLKVETHVLENVVPHFDSTSYIGELLNKPTAEEVREVSEAAPILVPFALPAASTEHLEPL